MRWDQWVNSDSRYLDFDSDLIWFGCETRSKLLSCHGPSHVMSLSEYVTATATELLNCWTAEQVSSIGVDTTGLVPLAAASCSMLKSIGQIVQGQWEPPSRGHRTTEPAEQLIENEMCWYSDTDSELVNAETKEPSQAMPSMNKDKAMNESRFTYVSLIWIDCYL